MDHANIARRALLKTSAWAMIAVGMGATARLLTPAQAHAIAAPFKILSNDQARTLGAVADTLVPGARGAGVVHYIDAQLAKPDADNLLILRYLDWPPPYPAFYAAAADALHALAVQAHDRSWDTLDIDTAEALAARITGANPEGWAGPPAGLVYFTLRADAVDVLYGTEAGFERLGVDYFPHIGPEQPW